VAAGSAIWGTHFVAILAFRSGTAASYDPLLTMISLLVAVVGSFVGLYVASLRNGRALPSLGGALFGMAIASMHYVGMMAYRLDGMMRWQPAGVVASVGLAITLTAVAMAAVQAQLGARLARFSPMILVVAILSLHFTAMGAVEIVPFVARTQVYDPDTMALGIATGLATMLVIAAGTLAQMIDVRAQRDVTTRIMTMELTDALTGLPNQRAFEAELARRIENAAPDTRLCLATMKLARFNDTIERHGRRTAELSIQAFAARLVSARRPGVYIARTGPVEFTGVGRAPDLHELRQRVQLLASALAVPVMIDGCEVLIDPRIGIACFPSDATTAEGVVQCSRLALARAKSDPLEPIGIYEEVSDMAMRRRHILADDLRNALDNNEFELVYQPQVWIGDRRIIGYEALLRWRHPQRGLISPVEFIPLAEQTGTIIAIGDWALHTACMEAAHWPNDCKVAVNVSPLQLRQHDLPERVHHALVCSGLSPARLEIELTESLLLDDRQRALHVLRRIRALGVRLALDDFGTGYSSLDVLRHFPFDKIKLDKTFVGDIASNPQSRAILAAMLAMGRSLEIPVLVEGVETEEQLAYLQTQGCNKVQGYLTGKPMSTAAIAAVTVTEMALNDTKMRRTG
jgi:diguanylate cyclase (GGDEF)-like protein